MTGSLPAPSASALNRALARAERGVTLDATEAETLMHARGLAEGEPLDRLLTTAARVRDAGLASAGCSSRSPTCAATAATTARS
jgi:FO synthase